MNARRCESCGRFVRANHPETVRHFYDIDHAQPVAVFTEATATRLQRRLDCPACSMPCCLMTEAARGHGVAVGADLPNGWERCDSQTTQADYAGVGA